MNLKYMTVARWLCALLAVGAISCSNGSPAPNEGAECTDGAPGTGVGGSGSMAPTQCDFSGSTTFAEIKPPSEKAFGEAAIAVAPGEVGVAYLQWDPTRHVDVLLQRFTLDGGPLGSPILLGGYDVTAGQLASGDFYHHLSMAASSSRFMACWGEAFQVGCASVEVGSGDVSTSVLTPLDGSFAYLPHVTFGVSGFRVFYKDTQLTAVRLKDDASPTGAPITVPALLATATASGYAVASNNPNQVFRLNGNLKADGEPIELAGRADSIAALGDAVSVVGSALETRIDESSRTSTSVVIDGCGTHPMAVAPHNDMVGVAWTSFDNVLRFRAVGAEGELYPYKKVGCAPFSVLPSVASVSDGFLVTALEPEGSYNIFYRDVYQSIRVIHVEQP